MSDSGNNVPGAGSSGSGLGVGAGSGADSGADSGKDPADRSSRLFDLRLLIGGLFTLYGVMVGGKGLFDSTADLAKSDGLRINLWTGIGMLVLGLLFLLWAFLRPLQRAAPSDDAPDQPHP